MTGDHVREQEGVTMHTNFSQMLLKEHLNASQLQGYLLLQHWTIRSECKVSVSTIIYPVETYSEKRLGLNRRDFHP